MKKEIKTSNELHEISLNYMSELEFLKDEQLFLEHLLSSHFLELSTEDLLAITRKLIRKLKEVEKMGIDLIGQLTLFDQQITLSIRDPHEKNTTDILKSLHLFKRDFDHYSLKFRYVKKKIFSLIKEIMINHKQKLLLK